MIAASAINHRKNRPHQQPAGCYVRHNGFALVVALALMSFLLLLLVSLAALTKVESSRTSSELAQFEARQNAMLGMRIAIAQLQKEAGPDRRITARADILAPTDVLPIAEPEAIPAIQPDSTRQFWTGVFDPDANRADMRNGVRWLVSGSPTGLASIGSGDTSGLFPIFASGFTADERIHVPLINIPVNDSGDSSGQFAYFVADEGIKAKITLANDPNRPASPAVAQRFGMENLRMGGDAEDWSELQDLIRDGLITLNDPTAPTDAIERLRRVNQLRDVHLLLGGNGNGEDSAADQQWRALLNRAAMDVTTHSFGLLTDLQNGSFRTDLTSFFAAAPPQGLIFPADRLEYGATMAAVSAANRRHLRGPDWRYLYNFAQLGNQIVPGVGANPDAIAPRPGGEPLVELNHTTPDFYPDAPTIAPIMISAGLRFGLNSRMIPDAGGSGIFITISPLVALWNPYDVRLLAEDYIVEFDNSGGSHWSSSPILSLALLDATNPWWQMHQSLFRFIDEENPWVPGQPERTWREHGTSANPPERRPFSMRINVAEFSPDFDPALLQAPGQSGSEDFRKHNLYFALESVELEPGEIAWFTLRHTGGTLNNVENRILTSGEHGGYLELPFHADMGYAQAHISGYQYRYHSNYEEDFGFVTDEDFEIGSARLSIQTERFIATLRMRDPTNSTSLTSELSTPPATRAFRDQTRWPIIQYMSCARTGQPRTSTLVPLDSLQPDDYLTQVHVRLSAPFQDLFHWPMSGSEPPSDTGLKLLANFGVRSRAQTSIGFSEIGISNYSSPLYRIDYHIDPLQEYFEPTELWEKYEYRNAAIFDESSPDEPAYGVALFHIPRGPLYSIGEFQHLDFSMSPWEPTYAVGNSLASPWIAADQLERRENNNHTRRDRSYILNDLLWDGFFFSTWNPSVAIRPTNSRMVPIVPPDETPPSLQPQEAGSLLMIDGPFNINSTSVEAWKALLSSLNLLELEYRSTPLSSLSSETVSNLFSRTHQPVGGTAGQHGATGFFSEADAAYWRGFRELSEQQIEELAVEIVRQVRERGPFRSLSHFVNRIPGTPDDDFPIDHALMGALQAAIELQSDQSSDPINPRDPSMWVYADGVGGVVNSYRYLYQDPALGPRRQGAPGYLMQADLLMPLGPIISGRSDTFLVRSYGTVTDPVTGDIQANAVGEAIIQRLPEFIDPADAPTVTELSVTNQRFGRRFAVLSFRWLSSDEI